MALSRVKTWSAGEVLTAADLNTEFNNILSNAFSLISPLTGNLDLNGQEMVLDADADSSLSVDTDDRADLKLGGTDIFRFNTVASAVNGIDFFGSATGNQPYLKPLGTDSNFGLDIRDSNGNEIIITDGVASAVNEITITNAATGNNPSITISGTDATGLDLLSGALNEAKGSDIASATTTDIGAATGNFVDITGTTTITGLGTVKAGTRRTLQFDGSLTLTHNATSLILPDGQNIITHAGYVADFVSLGSGNWKMTGDRTARPSFSVHRNNVDQTNITGDDKIEWTTEYFDTNSDFDSTTNYRFTPTVAGKYLFVVSVDWSLTTADDTTRLSLYKNGTAFKIFETKITSSTAGGQNFHAIVDANGSTDYFEIFAQNGARDTSSIKGDVEYTYWEGCKID